MLKSGTNWSRNKNTSSHEVGQTGGAARTGFTMVLLAATVGLTSGSAAWAAGGIGPGRAAPQFVEQPGALEFSGEMLARPLQRPVAVAHEARRLMLDAFDVREYLAPIDVFVFAVPPGQNENEAAAALMGTGLFEYVEPNWVVYPLLTPNDAFYPDQWHLAKIESPGAWAIHTGQPRVTIAVCDTGLRASHEDLLLNRVEGYNAVDQRWESQGGAIGDLVGHGTHVTGIAAANSDNTVGVAGVGWNFSHRILRVSNNPFGLSTIEILVHAGLTAAQQGDQVINLSYGGAATQSARIAGTAIKQMGGLMIWAAGNDGAYMGPPDLGDRDADDIIVVGSSTQADLRWGFSNYGPYVDFFAPGVGILSCGATTDRDYFPASGTSMAAPVVSGVAGLIWSRNPLLTPNQVEHILKATCDEIGGVQYVEGEHGNVSVVFGYGRVNARRAVEMAGDFLRLDVHPRVPIGGETVSFHVSNGTPGALTGVFYSTAGEGSTVIPGLGNVRLNIASAKPVGPLKEASSNGITGWRNRPVPNVPRNIRVWVQAAETFEDQSGVRTRTSLVVETMVRKQ